MDFLQNLGNIPTWLWAIILGVVVVIYLRRKKNK